MTGWKCEEVLSTHYAENVTAVNNQGTSPNPTTTATDIPEILFTLSARSKNVHSNEASDKTTNDEHVFTPQQKKFYFLSNKAEGRRVIFTNDLFSDDNNISSTTLKDILSLDIICKEWDKILGCFTRQLRDAVCVRGEFQINGLLITVSENIYNEQKKRSKRSLEEYHRRDRQIIPA